VNHPIDQDDDIIRIVQRSSLPPVGAHNESIAEIFGDVVSPVSKNNNGKAILSWTWRSAYGYYLEDVSWANDIPHHITDIFNATKSLKQKLHKLVLAAVNNPI